MTDDKLKQWCISNGGAIYASIPSFWIANWYMPGCSVIRGNRLGPAFVRKNGVCSWMWMGRTFTYLNDFTKYAKLTDSEVMFLCLKFGITDERSLLPSSMPTDLYT